MRQTKQKENIYFNELMLLSILNCIIQSIYQSLKVFLETKTTKFSQLTQLHVH
jgi:hypothetical protein